LPTEAEWEYACRAGSTEAYSFGGDRALLGSYAWYGAVFGQTNPVGKKAPNDWGLHDMHGNVWEWCYDMYGAYPPSTVKNPSGARDSDLRVVRGGAWNMSAASCRSANRRSVGVGERHIDYGLRVVLDASGI
jgi:formylglycine-generating enzyme required for sulfatase activity